MNVATLKTFAQMARALNFAAVAEQRGVNASSISRQIAELERQLGVRLFHRTTRTVRLTEAGLLFLHKIEPALAAMDDARDSLRAQTQQPTGTLKITASTALGQTVLMPLIHGFQQTYPAINLELVFTDQTVDLITEQIDLAIRLGSAISGDLITAKWFDFTYKICASPAYLSRHGLPATPSDLIRHHCLQYALPAFRNIWLFRQNGQTEDIAIKGSLTLSSPLSLRTAAEHGLGPALLADWLAAEPLANGKLIDLYPDHDVSAQDFERAAWFVYPSRHYLPQKTRLMIDHLRANTPARLKPAPC